MAIQHGKNSKHYTVKQASQQKKKKKTILDNLIDMKYPEQANS